MAQARSNQVPRIRKKSRCPFWNLARRSSSSHACHLTQPQMILAYPHHAPLPGRGHGDKPGERAHRHGAGRLINQPVFPSIPPASTTRGCGRGETHSASLLPFFSRSYTFFDKAGTRVVLDKRHFLHGEQSSYLYPSSSPPHLSVQLLWIFTTKISSAWQRS
jgi:hypothetical protein